MKNSGSMAELVDAMDLKSIDASRAGSTPATPTNNMAIQLPISDQMRQMLDNMPTLDYASNYFARKWIEGSYNMSRTERGNNEICACVSMFANHATQMGGLELENYVRNQIASQLIKQLIENKNLVITQKDNMYNYSIDFSTRVFIFSAEELKKHDQDVIEDFASRSD